MKQKKPKQPCPHPGLCGGHRNLTLLGCILSALSAGTGADPLCVRMACGKDVLETWPALTGVSGSARWGWTAVWTAVISIVLYFAALMSTHIAASARPEYPALCHGARAEATAWILHGQSVRTAQETDR